MNRSTSPLSVISPADSTALMPIASGIVDASMNCAVSIPDDVSVIGTVPESMNSAISLTDGVIATGIVAESTEVSTSSDDPGRIVTYAVGVSTYCAVSVLDPCTST